MHEVPPLDNNSPVSRALVPWMELTWPEDRVGASMLAFESIVKIMVELPFPLLAVALSSKLPVTLGVPESIPVA